MIQLNKTSTAFFGRLLDSLKPERKVQTFSVPARPPLVIEELGTVTFTEEDGIGVLYSIAHGNDEATANGHFPAMHFLVDDKRQFKNQWHRLHIYPVFYRKDETAIPQNSIIIHQQQIVKIDLGLQHDHRLMAAQWFYELHEAGFLHN